MEMIEIQNKEGNEENRKVLKKLIAETNKKIVNKKYDDAIADLSNIIDSYSNYPDGYVARADVYFILKKYNLALSDYQKALSLGDKTFLLYLKSANTRYELGLYKDSVKDYLNVLNLKSNYEYAYYKLIGAYIFTEDFNAALKTLNKYTQISSTKNIKINDYENWINVLNKYTENEVIRDLKSNLKKLKFV
jgi:tetratricopeptide (TPR) repeat protein